MAGIMWKILILVLPHLFTLSAFESQQFQISPERNCTIDDECYGEACIRLPITPVVPDPEEDLFEILDAGMLELDKYDNTQMGIFLFGNTGAGKSTVAQIIAGNLSRVYYVCSSACTFVIVDDDGMIGLPSTKSKTLVPGVLIKNGTNPDNDSLPFFDCPGFDDTRGSELDIAANFFTNYAIKKLQRFIVTKVASYNNVGRPISDESIIQGVTDFLRQYIVDQEGLLTGDVTADETVIRKIEFATVLLRTNPSNSNYERIWFVRSPHECGSLDEAEIMVNARQNITRLYDNLHYTSIDPITDFGFALADKTRLDLQQYIKTTSDSVNTIVEKTCNAMLNHYNQTLRTGVSWYSMDLPRYAENFKGMSKRLKESLSDAIEHKEPSNLLHVFGQFANVFGFDVPANVYEITEIRDKYFSFFQTVSTDELNHTEKWLKPANELANTVQNCADWYEFCVTVEAQILSYEFHKSKPNPPNDFNGSLLDYIDENVSKVSRNVRDVFAAATPSEQQLLNQMLKFVFAEKHIICNATTSTMQINGNFLTTAELRIHQKSKSACESANIVNLNIGHTIFWDDDDMVFTDTDLAALSPKWDFAKKESFSITLIGSNGVSFSSAAQSGKPGTAETGSNGCCGHPGRQSGSFFGIFIDSDTNVFINTKEIAGNGGSGQNGGDGGTGRDNRNATFALDSPDAEEHCLLNPSKTLYRQYGISGGKGGNGGAGGCPGERGINEGMIRLIGKINAPTIRPLRVEGEHGRSGNGGLGNIGGKAGMGYISACIFDGEMPEDPCCGRADGGRGTDGQNGGSSLSCTTRKTRREIEYWKQLHSYRIAHAQNPHSTTQEFVSFFDGSEKTRDIWNLKTLALEASALHSHSSTVKVDGKALIQLYASLIHRLEVFAQENYSTLPAEQQKVAGIVLTTCYSTMMNLNGARGDAIIVDVENFFVLVKQKILGLQTVAAIESVEVDVGTLRKELAAKVEQCIGYIDELVNPAIKEAGNDILQKQSMVKSQFESLIKDTRLTVTDLKNRIRMEIQILRELKIMATAARLANGIASMFPIPIPGFDVIVAELEEQYSDQKEIVAKLQEMRAEAEALLSDLTEKYAYFLTEVVPLIAPLMEYFNNVRDHLRNDSNPAAPELSVTKWQLLERINECKNKMEPLKDALAETRSVVHTLDRIMDAMSMSIDLYILIDQYLETQRMADYMANVTSAQLDPIPITDPEFKPIVADFDKRVIENMLDLEVKRAMFAFKQWVFPFAKLYVVPITQETIDYSNQSLKSRPLKLSGDHQRQVELILYDLQRYKTTTVGGQDTYIIQSNFSSAFKTSKPFYTWSNRHNSAEITALLKGETVNFHADVRQYGMPEREAIKFKQIEINFKLVNATDEMQAELDDLLEYFGVYLTHTGVSNYRFTDKYYLMTGTNQTIIYNFERDLSGNRLGTNMIYEKFKAGDFMLSPYTHWTIFALHKLKHILRD